jgi:hypothetical protein
MSTQQKVHIKLQYSNDFRRFVIEPEFKFDDLKQNISNILNISSPFSICYLDEESSWITISSDIELLTGIELSPSLLRLRITLPQVETPVNLDPSPVEEKKWRRNKKCRNENSEQTSDVEIDDGCAKWKQNKNDCAKWKNTENTENGEMKTPKKHPNKPVIRIIVIVINGNRTIMIVLNGNRTIMIVLNGNRTIMIVQNGKNIENGEMKTPNIPVIRTIMIVINGNRTIMIVLNGNRTIMIVQNGKNTENGEMKTTNKHPNKSVIRITVKMKTSNKPVIRIIVIVINGNRTKMIVLNGKNTENTENGEMKTPNKHPML